jgi:hypothetical protein
MSLQSISQSLCGIILSKFIPLALPQRAFNKEAVRQRLHLAINPLNFEVTRRDGLFFGFVRKIAPHTGQSSVRQAKLGVSDWVQVLIE